MHFLKSKMAAKMAGKTLMAIIQSWMKRLGSHFNHMCAERQRTFEKCALYAPLDTIKSLFISGGHPWALLGSFGLF